MKKRLLALAIIMLAMSLSGCAGDGGAYSGTLVLESRHIYGGGDVLNGVLVIVDGEVHLEAGAQVRGSIFMLGGSAEVNAQVDQDVSVIGGELVVGPEAFIGGDLQVGGGSYELSPQATVGGRVLTGPASQVELEDFFPSLSPRERLVQLLPWALVLAFLAYLAARYIPAPIARVSQAEMEHPIVSAAMGLLVGVVAPVLLVFMAFTVILIPVTLIGVLIGGLTIAYGWIGFGMAFGRWLVRRFNLELGRGEVAFLGTLAFMILFDLVSVIPYIGSVVSLIAVIIGIGAVTLTRFGLREFVPASEVLYYEEVEV